MSPLPRAPVFLGALVILLLVATPVGGSPSLSKGAHADYNWSVSISFVQSCETAGTMSPSLIACPLSMALPIEDTINGTIGWTVTDLNSTTAVLNVTRTIGMFNQGLSSPTVRPSHSFNETINLATRLVNLLPIIEPEMDQVLQSAQTSITSTLPKVNLASSISSFPGAITSRPFYTMWWVNGPLQLNQTIPVLLFPTNVTKSSMIDLGGTLGSRTAWTLETIFPHFIPQPDMTTSTISSIPVNDLFEESLFFNYDKSSDLLLTSNATLQMGFGEDMTVQQTPCDSTTSTISCPVSSGPTTIFREFGFTIQASLMLSNTNIDLGQRMSIGSSPQDQSSGSNSGSGISSGSNSGSGSNTGTNTGGSSNYGNGGPSTGSGQPAGNAQQPTSPMQASFWSPLIFIPIGLALAVAMGVLARKRSKKSTQTTN